MDRRTPKRLPFHHQPAFRLLLVQLAVASCAAVVLSCFVGKVAGYSGLLGGLIAWLPNLYFSFKAFRYRGAHAAPRHRPFFLLGRGGQTDSHGSALCTDVCRGKTAFGSCTVRRLPVDADGQCRRAPATEKTD